MKYFRMFEAASGLFPKKIKVTLVDAATGLLLGKYKIPIDLLPPAFDRPTILQIQEKNWRILKAEPTLADDFLFTKQLTLHARNAAVVDTDMHFLRPTVSSELPAIGANSLYHDFTLELLEYDWRQIEFQNLRETRVVENIIKEIEVVLSSQLNPLLGYEKHYIRETNSQQGLDILFSEFCALLTNPVYGDIFLQNNGFVHHGFAVRSDSYTYYGILEGMYIRMLCLNQFECANDEFMRILTAYKLLLVDWCNTSRISAEIGEEPKSEFIKF